MPTTLQQAKVNRTYSRNAWFYDLMDVPMERRYGRVLRPVLFAGLPSGANILEVGVGTGKSFACYPADARVTAIEPSAGMRGRATKTAHALGIDDRVSIEDADVQALPYDDGSFDAAVATFVFCSVADPVLGLRQIRRVLRPGGVLRLVEHQLPPNRFLAGLFNIMNPFVVRMVGANINRDTTQNVHLAGFHNVVSKPLDRFAIVRLITATV